VMPGGSTSRFTRQFAPRTEHAKTTQQEPLN